MTKWKKNTNGMHEYTCIYPYRMLPGAIFEFYNSVTMYLGLTHNIWKNKVNVDLEYFFYCMSMMEIVVVA